MSMRELSRRGFLGRTIGVVAGGIAAPYFVPRSALGGLGRKTPSDTITRAVIGPGGRGAAFVTRNEEGKPPVTLALCEVDDRRLAGRLKHAGTPCKGYHDFRDVMDRKDIDVVYIGTPPHWHALISIHAMQSGKDVYCEKPMTKFIAEGRAVADAVRRYGRVWHIGTFGRYGARQYRKLIASGILGKPVLVRMSHRFGYNFKVRRWSGRINPVPQRVPPHLHWDMWLGPAPVKPYHPHRCHGSFRGYWDYDGGGYTDMAAHFWDPVHYFIGMDNGGPLEVEAEAPWPAHPDAVGMWGSITHKFPGDIVVRCTSGECGTPDPEGLPFIEGPKGKVWKKGNRTEPPGLFDKLRDFPEPPAMIRFEQALWKRQQPGGNAEASHRLSTTMHLGNIAIRIGRKIHWDPAREQIIGDEEANRLVNIPMRRPWHL